MKKVFGSHSEVCHIWAQQNQEEGSANNVYFCGRVIFSYGSHYEMACIHGNAVLINSRGYSSSTGKHTGHVRSAVSHYETIDCPVVNPNGDIDHNSNIDHFRETIEGNQKRALTARTRGQCYIDRACEAGRDHNSYIALFDLESVRIDIDALFSEEAKTRIAAQVKEESRKAKIRREEKAKELSGALNGWKAGNTAHAWNFNSLPVVLRLYDGQVQTSHGARVDIEDARLLVRELQSGRDISGFSFGATTVSKGRCSFTFFSSHFCIIF